MRSPGELNGAWRCTCTMLPNYDIDFEFIARVVRLKDEPREIANFDSGYFFCGQKKTRYFFWGHMF